MHSCFKILHYSNYELLCGNEHDLNQLLNNMHNSNILERKNKKER